MPVPLESQNLVEPCIASGASRAVEAVVQIGETETRYRRSGRGAPVLLLLSVAATAMGAEAAPLAALSRHFRVISPTLPMSIHDRGTVVEPAFGAWLRDVIDGLGVERATIVAESNLGAALARFQAGDTERVERLVLFRGAATDVTGAASPDHGTHVPRQQPLVLHEMETDEQEASNWDEAAASIARLVLGTDPGASGV